VWSMNGLLILKTGKSGEIIKRDKSKEPLKNNDSLLFNGSFVNCFG